MRKLYRKKDNMIGGVCGGIANYADIDDSIVRLIFAGLIFTPFPIITIYIIAWIITPSKRYE
jgi:phage shock protein PspC (stress-responsive transcriptional regulator)